MADLNQQSEELAQILERVNEELRRYGRITEETANELKAAQDKRDKALTNAGAKTADALGHLANSAMSVGKAMLDGKKGAGAFNESLDDMAKAATAAGVALTFLIPGGPAIKLLIGAVTAATGAMVAYTKAANDMADKLYKGYSGMAKAGAAASDGMSGLFEDAKKLGLSMNELDGFVGVVGANSKDLALFGGTVFEGRKKLAAMGKELEGSRESFIKMGYSMQDVTEGMAGYIRQQARVGQAQDKTTAELAEGVKKYLIEQDALTKLTGMARQEQEAAREAAISEQRFAGKLEELRQQGKNKEAEALQRTNIMLMSQSKEAAQGFRDLSTGMIQTEAAQKLNMSTQGQAMEASQKMQAGQLEAAAGTRQIAKAAGETATALGTTMGQLGTFDNTFVNLGDSIKLRAMGERDLAAEEKKAQLEIEKQGGKGKEANDKLLEGQGKLINQQIKANEATERFVKLGIPRAQASMLTLAEAATVAAEKLYDLGGGNAKPGAKEAGEEASKKAGEEGKGFFGKMAARFGAEFKHMRGEAAKEREAESAGTETGEAAAPAGGTPSVVKKSAEPVKASNVTLEQMGLKIKKGDVQAEGAEVKGATLSLAKAVQEQITGFNYFSGFNDKYHQENSPSSTHTQGKAFDFALGTPPTPDEGKALVSQLKQMGAVNAIDEYNSPSSKSTAGHIHVQAMSKGGITDGISIAGEAGPEAVVPLPDGKKIPVEINAGNFAPPTREQLITAFGNDIKRLHNLIPGLNTDQSPNASTWSSQSGSAYNKMEMALTEMVKTNPSLALKKGQRRDVWDILSMILGTPEGKVYAAQNHIGVESPIADQTPEGVRLKQQYEQIRTELQMQNQAVSNLMLRGDRGGTGESVEDPLSRMEILAGDYVKRQQQRTARGVGDWQMGNDASPRVTVINEKVLSELKTIKDSLANTPKMADGGITKGPSIAGEAGPEAIVPLPNGRSIPVEMQGLDEMISSLGSLIELQRANNNTVEKLLRASMNQQ